MVQMTSVSGSGTYTVGISPALYMPNWAFAQTPYLIWNSPAATAYGLGLEDMTIVDTGGGAAVQMSNTYASWIKGVRFISTNANPINVSNSLYGLISNNYIFPNTALDGNFSPSILFQTSTATMILNNITISSTEAYEGYGLNVGNVGAFNFSRDSTSSQTFNILYDHHPFSSFDLFEGNQVAAGYEDDTWGTHALNTYFRNFMPCSDTPYLFGSLGQGNPLGMAVDSFQRFDNYVGNALGTLSECPDLSERQCWRGFESQRCWK